MLSVLRETADEISLMEKVLEAYRSRDERLKSRVRRADESPL